MKGNKKYLYVVEVLCIYQQQKEYKEKLEQVTGDTKVVVANA